MIPESLEERAKRFATMKHAEIGQVRKYTGEPYITHPAAVAEIVRSVDHDEYMLAAAWLHDTVEDTKTSIDEINAVFGDTVASYVEQLTDVSVLSDGNRAVRKEIDRQHTARAVAKVQTIKLADLIHNSQSIFRFDIGFAKVYLREKRLLLEVLKDGDATLMSKALDIVKSAEIDFKEARPALSGSINQ